MLPECLLAILWMQLTAVESRWSSSLPSTLNIGEGDSAIINCSYTGSASSSFPWYKQEPGKRSHLLIDTLENVDRKQKQRLTVLLDKKAKQFFLHITVTQPGDAAIYFCAATHNVSRHL
ncbi:T cell receptor alpha variable 13-1 [Lemmus lemmus]